MSLSKTNEVDSKHVILVVGETGLGKTSLIKIFCLKDENNELIESSGGAKPGTKEPVICYDNDNIHRWFMDTQGLDDGDEKELDEEILIRTLNHIFTNGIDRVKIIWMIEPGKRMTGKLNIQARFIESFLGDNSSEKNIWDSTLIIVKSAPLNPKSHVQGALASAYQTGARNSGKESKDHCPLGLVKNTGYTCVDWLDEEDDEIELEKVQDSGENRVKYGYLYEKEIKEHINKLLYELNVISISFNPKKCLKCGAIGDERCVPIQCHTKEEKYHDGQKEKYHPLSLEKYHLTPQTEQYHPEKTSSLKHTESLQYYHASSNFTSFHPGDIKHLKGISSSHTGRKIHTGSIEYYHSGYKKDKYYENTKKWKQCYRHNNSTNNDEWLQARVVTSGTYKCVKCDSENGCQAKMYHCGFCCTESDYNTLHRKKCSGLYCAKCVIDRSETKKIVTGKKCSDCGNNYSSKGCCARYKCCNGNGYSTGCVYSCCLKSSSDCSKANYSCCNQKPGSKGCVYSCCNGKIGTSTGCEEKYACCDGKKNSTGCKSRYPCCRKEGGSTGCSFRCCNNRESHSGCEKRYKCCGKDIKENSLGCAKRYGCCELKEGQKGCTTRWTCCGKDEDDTNENGCKSRCHKCLIEWGQSPGCQPKIKHDLMPQNME